MWFPKEREILTEPIQASSGVTPDGVELKTDKAWFSK